MKGDSGNDGGLSADDIALIAAVVTLLGDGLALWAIIKAKKETSQAAQEASQNTSQTTNQQSSQQANSRSYANSHRASKEATHVMRHPYR